METPMNFHFKSQGSEGRPLIEKTSLNQPIEALKQYLNEKARKNQFEQYPYHQLNSKNSQFQNGKCMQSSIWNADWISTIDTVKHFYVDI
ncbi:hypothetical protein PTKIN_Ptkin18bG0114400 [Pterospermum kingtungense]